LHLLCACPHTSCVPVLAPVVHLLGYLSCVCHRSIVGLSWHLLWVYYSSVVVSVVYPLWCPSCVHCDICCSICHCIYYRSIIMSIMGLSLYLLWVHCCIHCAPVLCLLWVHYGVCYAPVVASIIYLLWHLSLHLSSHLSSALEIGCWAYSSHPSACISKIVMN
jgi:hypothetical protein